MLNFGSPGAWLMWGSACQDTIDYLEFENK
jgi:hypothetical protein